MSQNKRKAARYIVMSKSLWQGDDWSPMTSEIFTSRKEAQAYADEHEDNGVRDGRQNLQYVENTRVMTWTEAKRHYGNEEDLWNAIASREHVETQHKGNIWNDDNWNEDLDWVDEEVWA